MHPAFIPGGIAVALAIFLAWDVAKSVRRKRAAEKARAERAAQGPSGDKARSVEEEWRSLLKSQEHRRMGAWEFFAWCDAVHTAHLEANPPAEKFKIERGANGRWFVKHYAGLSNSPEFVWSRSMDHPSPYPSQEHAWTQIGGDYGFSFQEEALDFFREFILAPADLKFDGEGLDLP